jgi:hypothetical protein
MDGAASERSSCGDGAIQLQELLDVMDRLRTRDRAGGHRPVPRSAERDGSGRASCSSARGGGPASVSASLVGHIALMRCSWRVGDQRRTASPTSRETMTISLGTGPGRRLAA